MWTRIRSAPDDPIILTELLESYWSPIYVFLRRSGYSEHEAEDLTQAFITDRLLKPNLYRGADRGKGRFRNYVLKALKNYLIDLNRASRREPSTCSLDMLSAGHAGADAMMASGDGEPGLAFEQEWAITIFQGALDRLRAECEASGQQIHWQAFEIAHPEVSSPSIQPSKRPTNDEIAARINARDATHVSILLNTVRRKYKRILQALIVETLEDPAEYEAELDLLRRRLP